MPTIGVILAGCGNIDGAEIHESVLTLLYLAQAGVTTKIYAPNVAFAAVVEGDVPGHVVGDPLRLNQVIYNLMGNAFKFTPEGGRVTLLIERLDDGEDGRLWLRFAVEDTGCGIEPEYLDKIFGSFEQGAVFGADIEGDAGVDHCVSDFDYHAV